MKRTRRRILSAALAAAMLLCTVPKDAPLWLVEPPLSAYADDSLTYDKKNDTLILSGVLIEPTVVTLRSDVYMDDYGEYHSTSYEKIVAAPGCVLPKDCSDLFMFFDNVKEIDLSNADTSNVTDMSRMFLGCTNLEKLDVSSFDTSNVTTMSVMFNDCPNLKTLNLSSFDTSKVESMEKMFGGCSALQRIYVSSLWNTAAVENAASDHGPGFLNLFSNCEKLKGGSGTTYDENNVCIDYARIDNPPDEPGYLSAQRFLSGTCGENLTWKFDAARRTLTIEGTGAMTEFEKEKIDPPWKEFADEIKTLTLPEGLTDISIKAFAGLNNLESVTIPASVLTVAPDAFACSGLKDVYFLSADTVIQGDEATFCNSVKIEKDENGENVVICGFTGTIHGKPDSGAKKYAQKYGRNFRFFPGNETEGACGDDLTWSYDAETQTLTIAGTGAMYEWDWYQNQKDDVIYDYPYDEEHRSAVCEYTEYSYATNAPWEAYKDKICWITLPEGITSISPYSFCHCSVLGTVVLPASLASLGGCAFYACPILKNVVVQNPEMAFDLNTETGWDVSWAISNNAKRKVTYEKEDDTYTMKLPYPSYPNNIYGYADSTAQTFAEKYDTWSGKLPTFKRLLHVTFDANGGTGELYGIMLGYPEDQKTVTLPECSFTAPETGMVFTGWDVRGETKQPGDVLTPEDDLTVKALWEHSFYEIKFEANGGTGEMDAKTVAVNAEFTFPLCGFTAPEGLSFTGWQISGAADKTWQPGEVFLLEQNVTLVPVWAKTVCTVTFDADGGTGEMEAKTIAVNAEFTFPKCKFTAPEGKQFSAWMIGEDTYEIGDTVTIAEDTVIKAVWTGVQEDPFVPASGKKRGNLDGSGAIDTKDAMLLSRYVNGWEDALPDPEAADIDGDGDITVRDAMILTRYVNGWEGYGKYFDTES